MLFNIPCLFAIAELGGARLPGSEEAWSAARPSAWNAAMQEQDHQEPPMFLNVLGLLLADAKLKDPLNDFSSALLAHTVYRSVPASQAPPIFADEPSHQTLLGRVLSEPSAGGWRIVH